MTTMGAAIKQGWASECPDVKNYKWRLNPVWHRTLYSSTHMVTVGVKGPTFNATTMITGLYAGFSSLSCLLHSTPSPLIGACCWLARAFNRPLFNVIGSCYYVQTGQGKLQCSGRPLLHVSYCIEFVIWHYVTCIWLYRLRLSPTTSHGLPREVKF